MDYHGRAVARALFPAKLMNAHPPSERTAALWALTQLDPSSPLCATPQRGDVSGLLEAILEADILAPKHRPWVQNALLTLGRNLLLVDSLLAPLLQKRPLHRLPPPLRSVLRLGASELLFGDAPAYAVVSSWVDEGRAAGAAAHAKLVNAVLRRVAEFAERAGKSFAAADATIAALPESSAAIACARMLASGEPALLERLPGIPVEQLSLISSLPLWLLEIWRETQGEDFAPVLSSLQRPHRQALRWDYSAFNRKLDPATAELVAHLKSTAERVDFLGAEYMLAPTGEASSLRSAFNAGLLSLQGVSSQAVLHRFPPPAEGMVLDACAGSGIKATGLALMMGGASRLVACDLSPDKLNELVANFTRLRLEPPRAFACDFTDAGACGSLQAGFAQGFARIYVDAPCTGTGTLRRLPYKRYQLRPGDAARLAETQLKLIQSAATLLAPDGDIVYITCSLQREENELVVEQACASAGLGMDGEQLFIAPVQDWLEGMYAVRLVKPRSGY